MRGQSVGESQVEIRWNGVRGEVLATVKAQAALFAVPVKIPAVEPGIYSMTVVTPDSGINRTAIEVTGAASSPSATPAKLWPTLASAPSATAPGSAGVSPVGVALLSVGLVGLASGSVAAAARRRRAVAR